MPPHFLLRGDWAIAQLAVPQATAKSDFPAAFPRRAREMESHRVVAAVSFGARSSPGPDPFAAVLFVLCRCSTGFVPLDFVTAVAGPFGFADFGSAAAVVVVVVVVVADPVLSLSAADLSAVAVDPGSADSAADLSCSVYSFVEELGKERAVALVSCFSTRRFSF